MSYKMTLEDALAIMICYTQGHSSGTKHWLEAVNEADRVMREHVNTVLGELDDDQAEC